MKELMKKRYRISIASSVAIFLTIGLIILENVLKYDRFLSLIGLSISFILMGVVQIFNYKITKRKMNIFLCIVYFLAGIANLVFLISRYGLK